MKLTDAAKHGKSQVVVDAIKNGDKVNAQVLLSKACQDFHTIKKHAGHLELIRFLISVGAKPERRMVCEAARGGHSVFIDALLDGGLELDIFTAAALGDVATVQGHITRALSSVTHTDSQGMTPLHYCCASRIWQGSGEMKRHFLDTSSLLISAGADVHASGVYHGLGGVTPLFYTSWTGAHPDIVNQLLNHGAKITQNVFFAAVGHFQRHGDGNYEIAETLIEKGFNVNHSEGRTALHAFANHEDARGVRWLLEHGADVDARDAGGDTPLIAAARRNNGTKVLRVLVEAGASVSACNPSGQSALDAATSAGKSKAEAYLRTLW